MRYVPKQIKQAIRDKYAWPGGYPLYLVTQDGAALCTSCGRKEYRQIVWDYHHDASTGWRAVAADINWEDTELICDHCNKPIESA